MVSAGGVVNDLTTLPNIGDKLAAKLETAGVRSPKELSAIGSVELTDS
jgi:predicted flap endonuclease-1-like 5' DNA nuclease